MKKKIVGIFVIILMISSAMTTILFSNNSKVEASGGEPQGGGVNLDYNWVWLQAQKFANVIHDVNWSENGENNIPKGRSWATAGENYTIYEILEPNMNGTDKSCGLTNYTNLAIGYLPGCFEPNTTKPKQYSSKIIIKDYGLTIKNNGQLYRTIPYSELFPIAVGAETPIKYPLTNIYSFTDAKVKEIDLSKWEYITDHCNVSASVFTIQDPVAGKVVYINDYDSVPENQSSLVFVFNENPTCEQKMANITDASVILIQNTTKGYTFNTSQMNFPIVKINGSNSNFTKVISEVNNGSTYVVENVVDNQTLVFSNFSNESCFSFQDYVWIDRRLAPSDPNAFTLFGKSGAYYDFVRLVFWENIWRFAPRCKGMILSDFTDTHFMTHSVSDWKWHSPHSYNDRWWMPTFSVNKTIGNYLINHLDTATVTGFINQEYRQQTNTTPGVISHNVVAYRNISHSPNDAITVLSNRMDGWWGATPGDSGVGGAILLGIAKYFKDNNITPKYNLTFLFTTGEEYGMRGAHHFVDSHPNGTGDQQYNFVHFIGFDQLGFNYTNSTSKKISLEINTKNTTMQSIISAIAYQTNYLDRTHNLYNLTVNPAPVGGSEDKVWKKNCWNTVCFGRDDAWDGYHRAGMNFSEGDSLNYIDRNDVNVTFELAWNVTKYFTVNPNCQFDGTVTYTRTDSPNDEDDDLDTIEATMPLKSILPNDKVRVKAELKNLLNFPVASTTEDYIVSNITSYHTINVTLPPNKLPGLYKLCLSLYNSTGRINVIIWPILNDNPDDEDASDYRLLYPRGNNPPTTPTQPDGPISVKRWERAYWGSMSLDPNGDRIGQKWYWSYNWFPNTYINYGLIDGDGLYVPNRYSTLGTHRIQVKAYDQYSTLLHPYETDFSEPLDVEVTPWCDIFEQQQTHQEGLIHLVESLPQQFYGLLSGGESHVFEWNFNDQSKCSTQQNPAHTYAVSGTYNVTFNVTDEATQLTGRSYVHVRVSDLDSDFNMSYYNGAAPDTAISFRNTSKAKTGNSITNITWDFDDGIISYASIVNHTFEDDGDYNVTLTVKDSANNTDVDYAILHITSDPNLLEIPYVQSPGILPPDSEATILAEIIATDRNISSVTVNITTPNGTNGNYTMTEIVDNIFIYTLDNTSQNGQFNFTIWATDIENNTNSTTGNFSMIVPLPYFESPTPANNANRNKNWARVNVTVLDPLNTSAFIDWNHSLRGYWPMDLYNTTGIFDNSTYDNFGTFQNGLNTSNIKTGKYGKGLEFDGTDDYADLGTNSSLDLGIGDFTFMVWEKSHVSSYSKKAMILTNSPAMENWKGYGFGVVNHAYLFVSQSSGNNVTVQGTADVTDNTWHHIAYVNNEGDYSIYVDGAFDANGMLTSEKNITNSQNTYLAYDGHTSNWCYFDGMLDEPQLYNRVLSREEINASYNNGLNHLYHNFTGLPDGTYSYYAHAIDTSGNQSTTETRQITIDTTPPTITNVNATPHTVGFGYNVTITADVIDNCSGVDLVNVQITYPGGIGNSSNHTMTHVTNDTYQYVFNDTWLTGQYNYTIWAVDNSNNSNSSGGHHFHVSATATISIATLKNSYSGSQYINITDPPNPPENYTLVARGLTWNTYYNASTGENILETYQGPVNYQEDNGTWMPINNSLNQLGTNHPAYNYGYRTGNDRGLFGIYFKPNAQNDWPVAFTYNRSDNPTTNVIRSKLVGVGYVDPQSNWAYQYLQNVQSSQGQTNGNSVTYTNVFTGTDVTWSYGNTELKEEITLSNVTKTVLQNHPPSMYGLNNGSSYLVFITKLDHQNLDMYNDSGLLYGNVTISDTGIDFKDTLGLFKCALPLGEAYELNNESMRQKLTYRIVHLNGNTYLLSGLKVSDLNAMAFPVVIDPTLTVYSTSSDGYIYNSGTNYNTVRTASSGTVNSSGTYITIGQKKISFPGTYYIYRGFVFFNTSALPSNAYLDTATLSLYKKDDYSTTDFDITIQNGQPTYPHNPMQSSDYNRNDYSGNGGALNTSLFTSGYNAIKMNYLSWINKTGTTKLCLRSSRDISGTTPTSSEYINVYSNEFLGSCPPKLVIAYRNQSKIKNTGSTNIKGYLLIQIQFYNTSQSKWVLDNDTVNETTPRTINIGSQLALDTIFNGKIRASNLQHGTGTYRVYAAFRDPEGNILKTNSGSELKAWWQFSKT